MVKGQKSSQAELIGYTAILNKFLIWDITNIRVCLECLQEEGFPGGLIIVKNFIAAHRFLIPTRWQLVAPQGNRDRRFTTES